VLQVAGCQLLPVVLRLPVRWPRLNGLSITSNNESPFTNLAKAADSVNYYALRLRLPVPVPVALVVLVLVLLQGRDAFLFNFEIFKRCSAGPILCLVVRITQGGNISKNCLYVLSRLDSAHMNALSESRPPGISSVTLPRPLASETKSQLTRLGALGRPTQCGKHT